MRVETRKTAAGMEYWDNKEKRTVFVPAGQKPDFEVTKDPKSMVGDQKPADKSNLDEMNEEQLRAFAKEKDIEIPGNIKKEETVRKHIAEELSK